MHLFIESLESRCLLSGSSPLISATASMLSPAIHAARSAAPSVNLVGTCIGSYDTTDGFTGSVAVVVKSQGKSSATGTLYIDGVPYRGTAKLTTGLNGAFTLTYKQKGFGGCCGRSGGR